MNIKSRINFLVTFFLLAGLAGFNTSIAKGPPGKIDVNSASPDYAVQGEEKDILIGGTGFGTGSIVRFFVTGTQDDTQIEVMTVEFVAATGELKAHIKVKDTAVVIYYDIEVEAASGRKGKGTTLFNVQSKDGTTGNDDKAGRAMICSLNEDGESGATVMDDGDPVYENGVEQVLCLSGDVTGDHLAPLRFANLPGGNPKQIKFADRFLDLAFGNCDGAGCSNLPADLVDSATLDTAYVHVSPYTEQGHIHLLAPGLHGLPMFIDAKGFDDRYLIQMSNRNSGPGNRNLWCFDAQGYEVTDDINVFVWQDGVYSGVEDGLPDGYTVTTGNILSPESVGTPPKVEPGNAQALVCSNIGPGGASCLDRKHRDDLCYALGTVDISFTLNMVYK